MSIPSHQSSTSSTPDQSDIVRLPSPVSSSGQVNIRKKSEPSSRPVTRQSIRASVREFIFNNPLVNKRNSSENSLSRVGQSFRIKYSPSSDEGKSDKFSGIDRQDSREDTKRKKSRESPFEECALCFDEYPPEQLATLMSCDHKPCRTCLAQYLKIEISESRVMVACPECDTPVHPNDIYSIITDRNLLDKYEDFMVRRVLVADPDTRWCPAPDCGYAVIAAGCAGCPNLKCERPGCGMEFCYHCKAEWHPDQTCDAARSGRKTRSGREGSFIGSLGEQLSVSQDRLRHCPRCSVLIMKVDDGSCNHMTCAVCGAEFCWLCMKEISDLHYLSPSGCTFWGKKPWSKKKKILWQVGTLIGAPVGIALLAGIAIPGIVIGVPFWVGRKLSTRSKKKKPRNKAVVATAVVASIFVSPFLAALAVALGVPICLAYVYGVVPISLCRSGGCGGSASSKSGMKMELDGNPDLLPYGAQNKHSDLSVSDIGTERPDSSSQVDVSLGMSSHSIASGRCAEAGCPDGGNNTAQAGGSYCKRFDGTCETNSKRMSLTSETVSESERSVTLSCADDCSSSTRGFAGSVLNYKFSHARNPGNASHTPAEVYIDGRAATVLEENGSAGDLALVLMRRSCKKGRTNTNKQVVCEQEGEKSQDHVIDVEVCDEPAYMTPPEDHFRHSSRTDLKSLAVSIATQLSEEVLSSPVLDDQVAVSVSDLR